ncbi:MAG: hypothetical protein IJQ12_06835 [Lachnospiraceae bacterium]|nr:hypothetical protein [Lachnospiraceae bacterium]
MFGKILVQQIRNSWRIPLIMAGVAIVLTLIAALQVRVLMSESTMRFTAPTIVRIFIVIFLVLYVIYMVAANTVMTIIMPVRFYRESFSDQGYLYHSLPVTKNQFFASHVIVSGVWILLFYLVDYLCVMIVVSNITDLSSLFRSAIDMLTREMRYLFSGAQGTVNGMMIVALITFLVSPFASVIRLNCAVTLGQLFKKHRVIGAIVMYFALNFAVGMINQVTSVVSMIGKDMTSVQQGLGMMLMTSVLALVMTIAESAVFWWLSVHRMEKDLDLE